MKDKEIKVRAQLHELSKDLEGLTSKHLSLKKKIQEIQAIGGNLGTVPGDADKYSDKNSKGLYSKLKKINIALKGMDGVNQKAAEQYQELSEKYELFRSRLNTLVNERTEMDELIEDLENRKGAAILKILRDLQEQFKKIFRKIVPIGDAELVLYAENLEVNRNTEIDNVSPYIKDLKFKL